MEKDDDGIFIRKRPEDSAIPFTNIKETNTNFVNTKPKEEVKFVELEKTPQQLKLEKLEEEERLRAA